MTLMISNLILDVSIGSKKRTYPASGVAIFTRMLPQVDLSTYDYVDEEISLVYSFA